MNPRTTTRPSRPLRAAVAAVALAAATVSGVGLAATPAQASGGAPGDFYGRAFDQCNAPSQSAMTAWWNASPYAGVGIYISGDSRACTAQPNLTPNWVRTQLAAGWHLLPITLGPQAACTTRDRYLHQTRISASTADGYAQARQQGQAEARKTIARATALGIPQGSTMFYDLEAFDTRRSTACTESAKWFVSAWTAELQGRGWKSGFYSSGASGIRMLDDARVATPGRFRMPDQIWVADWNGQMSTASAYVRADGWTPHRRVHQYRGDHVESYGGVGIDIDSNLADLGRGAYVAPEPRHAGGVSWNPASYADLRPGSANTTQVKVLQGLLTSAGLYRGGVTGTWNPQLGSAVSAFRQANGWRPTTSWGRSAWMALVTRGATPVVKYGSAGPEVRRLQRALNASGVPRKVTVTGQLNAATVAAVQDYQRTRRLAATGVVDPGTWAQLRRGMR